MAKPPPHEIGPGNRLANNTEGVRIGEGDAQNASRAAAFLHDNVIENGTVGVNVTAGVYMTDTTGLHWALYSGRARLLRNTIANFSGEGIRVSLRANRSIPDAPPYAEVLDGNTIRNATYGVRVMSTVNSSSVDPGIRPYANVTDRNTIEGRPSGVSYGVHLQGVVYGGNTYAVWANVSENNTIANATYGVWIHNDTVDLGPGKFRLWWNDVRQNTEGVHVTGDPPGPDYFHAECNWWNSAGGPYDPIPPPAGEPDWNDNPDPNAQPVSDYFYYRELNPPPPPYVPKGWLNRTASDPLAACNGGV